MNIKKGRETMTDNNNEMSRIDAWNGYSSNSEAFKDSYDWPEAFRVACRDRISRCEGSNPETSLTPFTANDIFLIYASAEGENDSESWMGMFLLKDGRFVFIDSWCDYSGWGWQDGGYAVVSDSLEALIQYGLTDPARIRLNVDYIPPVIEKKKEEND